MAKIDDSNSSADDADNVFFGDPFIDDDEEGEGWDDDLQSPELSSDDEHYVAFRQGMTYA